MVSNHAHYIAPAGSLCRSAEKRVDDAGIADAGALAISGQRSLTDLEGQLGVQLFDRVGKRLVVNEHGRLLYPRALALLEQAIEIEQLFREDNGAIRVYASSTIGNYILPEVIARYRRDFPTLPLEMSVGNSQTSSTR